MTNRIRYFLKSPYFGTSEIEEPLNWESDEKELMRSDKHAGIIKNISNNMQFHNSGKELVDSAYQIAGIKADVKIERQVRNDENDIWEVDYFGWLDFATYKSNDSTTELKVNENKFFKTIESRYKDKFELDRLTDVKGNAIPPLEYVNLELEGREIFLESKLKAKEYIYYFTNPAAAYALPLENLEFKSDQNIFSTAISTNESGLIDLTEAKVFDEFGNYTFNAGQFFYIDAQNENPMLMKIKGQMAISCQGDLSTNVQFLVYGIKKDENGNYDPTDLNGFNFSPNINLQPNQPQVINIDIEEVYIKRLGDNIALIINSTIPTLNFLVQIYNLEITFEETIPSNTTNCKALRVDTAIDRLLHIITGKRTYQSTILNSFWKDLLITNGFLIRQIPDKSITLSLEDILTGLGVIDDIAWIIENEQVFVERLNFVYRNTILNIGTLANKSEETIPNLHYSKIAIGYDFDGEYEEVVGLDEYNIKNEYTTPIDNQDEPIELISKVFADSYGITLAQLKPFETNPKLDTKYDKNNYFIDAKISANKYVVRHWQDDFDNAPTGIFSPDTAFNLRLSPFNCLLRKGRFLSVGFQKFQNERLIYSSTEGNSQLVTIYPERANELVSILERPYHLPEMIMGTIELSFSEYTNIMRNKYNLLTFTDRNGNVGRGYLKSIKPNGNTAEITLFKVK